MQPLMSATFPYYFGVGDHQYIVVDFTIAKFLGKGFIPMYKPEICCLTIKQPKAVQSYLKCAESLFQHHQIE